MNAFDLYVRIRAALNAERKNAGHNRDIAEKSRWTGQSTR